ncbi:hypothetical protein [Maribacter halichondriae]|uniref:hypothetical protein n=1 Tax=Maribacter halichondriae TaxID=2980554 RepID=UPI002358450C|nr:hypothetical protein [Maribacter sp. Hal144]
MTNTKKTKKKREKIKKFKAELLYRLQKIYDSVDGARLLIEAHKSAKTYSERIRLNIIPSITALFDIKRNLVGSEDMMKGKEEKLKQLRLYIHYLIAYLQVLADEYKTDYPAISNRQFLHERLKERAGEDFVKKMVETHPESYFSSEVLLSEKTHQLIQQPPKWVWKAIQDLPHMGQFITDDYDSPYRKMFVDFYEACKKLLKDKEIIKLPEWYDVEHMNSMDDIDKRIEKGLIKQDDSLVDTLVGYLNKKSKKINL